MVLFPFYLINLAGQVLPVRVAAAMALIGLGLLQLATYVDRGNGALSARRRNLSSLAIVAVV